LTTHKDFDRSTFKQKEGDDRENDQCYLFKKNKTYELEHYDQYYTTCKASDWFLVDSPAEFCPAGSRNATQDECLAAAKSLVGEKMSDRKTLQENQEGQWLMVPSGCSVQSGGPDWAAHYPDYKPDWAAHYNHTIHTTNPGYAMVCTRWFLVEYPAQSCPARSRSATQDECLAAAKSLVEEKMSNRKTLQEGQWSRDGVPSGCSVQVGSSELTAQFPDHTPDWAAHYNHGIDTNKGYDLVCTVTL
jgi:hypothetical protein